MVILPHRRKAFRSSDSGATGGDPYFSNVVLLMHFEGTNGSTTFIDSSSANRAFTANGNAQISTAKQKVGTSSMYLDGTGDYIISNSASADFSFGTSTDFTVEGWVYIVGGEFSGQNARCNWFCTTNRTYYFGLYDEQIIVGNGAVNLSIYNVSFSGYTNKWTYVTHTRSGSNNYIFLDGVLKQTVVSAASIGGNDTINIGRDPVFGAVTKGWIDEFRVTKGVCRYTANFTPPSPPALSDN